MAESTAGKVAGQATKQSMKMLTNTAINAAGAAIGIPPGLAKPILGCIIALIALVVGTVFTIGFGDAYYSTLQRQFNRDTSNGGALNSLTTVNPGVTIYVNLVYPGGSECTSAYGGEYIFKKDSTEVGCSSVTAAQRADSGFKIGVKLANTFYEGAAAANNLTVFPGGAPYSGSPTAAQGNTHWLYIPGYHNSPTGTPSTGVPVVGVIAPTKNTPKGKNNEDFTMRFDLLVKDGTEQAAIIAAWQANDNCKPASDEYQCAVSGVIVKFGQQNSGSPSELVEIARGELGNREVGSTNQGPEINKYFQGAAPGAWCAYFVTWVHTQANTGIPSIGSTEVLKKHYTDHEIFFTPGQMTPEPGDTFFMDGHVGIVTAVEGDYILTIEGNTGSGVSDKNKHLISPDHLQGFGRLQ